MYFRIDKRIKLNIIQYISDTKESHQNLLNDQFSRLCHAISTNMKNPMVSQL